MSGFEIARDVATLLIALIGAGLSIYNFVDARSRNRRQLRVTMGTAIPTYPDGSLGQTFAQITVTNAGHRDVTVSSIGITLPGGGTLASFEADPFPGMPDTRLPTTLRDGHQAIKHYSYAGIGHALLDGRGPAKIRITPYAKDSTGKVHKGEPWDVDPAEIARMR